MHQLFNCAVVVYAGGCCLAVCSPKAASVIESATGDRIIIRLVSSTVGGGVSLGSPRFCGHLAVICTAAQWMFVEVWQCFILLTLTTHRQNSSALCSLM